MHEGIGYRIEWDDGFGVAYGGDWRHKRDSCTTLADWLMLYLEFERTVCARWNLPRPVDPAQRHQDTLPSLPPPAKQRRTDAYSLRELPNSHGEGAPQTEWDGAGGHFCFITDCQPLAGILNGDVVLLNDDLLPLITRVSEKLFEMVEGGWLPNRRGANPIQWHRRCWNKIADHLANHTMNAEKSWNQRFEPPGGWLDAKSVNFLIHTYGVPAPTGARRRRGTLKSTHV